MEKALKIVLVILFMGSAYLIYNIIRLEKEIRVLESKIEQRDKSITKINKKSYNRFIIAKDLTDICNKYQSSKKAKEEYYKNK
jgi:predicted Holliday junction resolvase-like endonuclease